jgi:hypothetical protein
MKLPYTRQAYNALLLTSSRRYHSFYFLIALALASCSSNDSKFREEIRIPTATEEANPADTAMANSISGNLTSGQVATNPSSVILTGMPQHRLVPLYKPTAAGIAARRYFNYDRGEYETSYENDYQQHFMPGLDLIHGYNLLNIAHYNLATEKLNHLFDHPVLVRSLYYPSFEQDSIDEKPVNRNYYLVSVYDADTNADTLINKHDLRRFYYFNADATEKLQLVPSDYSVVSSQYDWQNDVMFIYSRHDNNKNGTADKKEPLHIFWFSLKTPAPAKRLY